MRRATLPVLVTLPLLILAFRPSPGAPPDPDPVRRALGFLGREVPRWSRENRCFSCHNNGDGARALLAASRGPLATAPEALADTLEFLARPGRWDENGVDAAFSDKRLARLQFAAALGAAIDAGKVRDRGALLLSADLVARDQAEDGSWPIDDDAIVGSPATYGRPLATALACRTLRAADPVRFAAPVDRAEHWLAARPVRNVLDASALLLGLPARGDTFPEPRTNALALLRRAQSDGGGWGPFLHAPPEAFDTALALLALSRWPDRAAVEPLLRRGRAALIARQADDGSWPETTRPGGGESYAQRLSTTGWATLALIESN